MGSRARREDRMLRTCFTRHSPVSCKALGTITSVSPRAFDMVSGVRLGSLLQFWISCIYVISVIGRSVRRFWNGGHKMWDLSVFDYGATPLRLFAPWSLLSRLTRTAPTIYTLHLPFERRQSKCLFIIDSGWVLVPANLWGKSSKNTNIWFDPPLLGCKNV